YYTDVQSNTTLCNSHVIDYTNNFTNDLASAATTPNYAFVVPNHCHQGTNTSCTIADADGFLASFLPLVEGSRAWTTQRSLLLVVFDEDDYAHDNQVYMAAVGSQGLVKSGYVSTQPTGGHYDHFSMMRTIEAALGLGTTPTGNDNTAIPMADLFNQVTSPIANFTYPTNNQTGVD